MSGTKNLEGKPEARYIYLEPLAMVYDCNDRVVDCANLVDKLQEYVIIDDEHGVKVCIQLFLNKINGALDYVADELQKIELDLFIEGLHTVSALGVKNHGLNNYKKGLKTEWLLDAMSRHMVKQIIYAKPDEGSGTSHLYHVAANMLMLYYNLQHEKNQE